MKELQGIRLSMDSLYSKFCPGKQFTGECFDHSYIWYYEALFKNHLKSFYCKDLVDNSIIKDNVLVIDNSLNLDRHRAMGDVNAMVEIFSKEPFRKAIDNIEFATTKSL